MSAARHALGVLAPLALVACATPPPPGPAGTPTTIQASDSSVFLSTVRIGKEEPRSYSDPSDVGNGGAFEFSYFRGSGSDTQTLGASQGPIRFGGESFAAPLEVRHDFTLNWYEFDARGRLFSPTPDRNVGIEFVAGVAFPRLDFRVSSPTQRAAESFGTWGATVGLGGLLRFREGTHAHARYSYYLGLSGADDIHHATRTELYLVQALSRNVAVRAGYVDWSLRVTKGDNNRSDLELNIRGPSLGLDVLF